MYLTKKNVFFKIHNATAAFRSQWWVSVTYQPTDWLNLLIPLGLLSNCVTVNHVVPGFYYEGEIIIIYDHLKKNTSESLTKKIFQPPLAV